MSPCPLTNFESQLYYQNVSKRNKLPNNAKEGADVIILHGYVNTGTQCVARYVKNNNEIYFDVFWVEHILKEI